MSNVQAVKNIWNRLIRHDKDYKHLAKVHIDLVQRMNKHEPVVAELGVDKKEVQRQFNEGIPFLEGREDQLDIQFGVMLFKELCQWSGLGTALQTFKQMSKDISYEKIEDLLSSWLEGNGTLLEQLSEDYQIQPDLFQIVIRYSLLPTLNQYANQYFALGIFQDEEWMKEYCPVCGDQHGLAEFRGDEGARHFRCLSCAADWKYWRIGCPYCQNREHEQLFSLFVKKDEGKFQIDICEQCHGYVKALHKLDQSAFPMLLLDDFSTLHLDMLAEEKGYRKGQRETEQVH